MSKEQFLRRAIKEITEKKGVRQNYIAETCGISTFTFSKWVNEKRDYGKRNLESIEKYILDFFKVENYWEVQI